MHDVLLQCQNEKCSLYDVLNMSAETAVLSASRHIDGTAAMSGIS